MELKELLLESFIKYQLSFQGGKLDLFAGTRFLNIDVFMNLDGPLFSGEAEKGDSWVDPVLGARVLYELSEKWVAGLRADIGGFGIGSDLSYDMQPSIGYHFSNNFSLYAQYKYLHVDYDNGKDRSRDFFAYKVATHGPLLEFVFQF